MKSLGNVLWFILGGFLTSIGFFLTGVVLCITILFIPVGLQYFKLARFVLWPFGKKVTSVNPSGFKKVINVIHAIFGGWINALILLLVGVIFCVTIIGIPFGKQYFKMAHFVLLPLGNDFQE